MKVIVTTNLQIVQYIKKKSYFFILLGQFIILFENCTFQLDETHAKTNNKLYSA